MGFASTLALDTISTDLTTMILGATVTIIMRTDIDGTARTIGIITIGIECSGFEAGKSESYLIHSEHWSDAQHQTYDVPEIDSAIRLLGTAKRRTARPKAPAVGVRV